MAAVEATSCRPRRVLVVGATSAIGAAICRILAPRGWVLILTGRDPSRLDSLANEIMSLGTTTHTMALDVADAAAVDGCVRRAVELAGGELDGAIICHGWSPPERDRKLEPDEIRMVFDVNLTSAAVILSTVAATLPARGFRESPSSPPHPGGFLAVISSVAGDRGRPGNFTYGAAKAGLTAYASGLRARMHCRGISVLTVKPGYVDSPMLRGLGVRRSAIVADPRQVARDIVRAIDAHGDILYTPWWWRWVLCAVRLLPEAIFKRLDT